VKLNCAPYHSRHWAGSSSLSPASLEPRAESLPRKPFLHYSSCSPRYLACTLFSSNATIQYTHPPERILVIMLLETFLRRLLQLYLQISSEKHPLLLETLNRITRACSSSSFCSSNAPKPTLPMRAVVSPILPGKLFLSGITAASSPETLKEYEITHVLSIVTTSEAPTLPEGIKHLIIPLSDTSTSNLLQTLPDATTFIKSAFRESKNAKVLVHCVEGVSRSASIVIAYLMSERGMSFSQALRIVKRRRAVVSPNPGFVRQLSEWDTICEAKRRERPREWEQVLKKRKASPPSPPVKVVKVPKRSKISWVRWAFAGDSGCRMS